MSPLRRRRALALVLLFAPPALGCDAKNSHVVLENRYSPSTALVVYRAFWQAVRFEKPVAPGGVSDAADTVAASDNSAYALLAPGWDAASATPPAALVVVRSRHGFGVHLDQTLHLPVDDDDFVGRCGAGGALTEDEADFITTRVFADVFAGRSYDAASCTVSP